MDATDVDPYNKKKILCQENWGNTVPRKWLLKNWTFKNIILELSITEIGIAPTYQLKQLSFIKVTCTYNKWSNNQKS